MRQAQGVPAAAFSVIVFVSGAAGLIFEMVWFQLCSLVFGNSLWSTAIVLSSFMAGMAAGGAAIGARGHRIRSLLRAYAALECVVACSGIALTYVLPEVAATLTRVARPAVNSVLLTSAIRLAAAFGALAVPSIAMGATLPVLVGALARSEPRFGVALGKVYGWNTLGAVAGVVAAELLLIGALGIRGTGWVAALLNLSAASGALILAGRPGETRRAPSAERTPPAEFSLQPAGVLACAFLAGLNLMALEVVWFRFLSLFMINSSLAFSLMLAVVLSALALGGLAASLWIRRNPHAGRWAPAAAIGSAFSTMLTYVWFAPLTEGSWTSEPWRILWMAGVLTFPPSLLSGLLFTLVGDILKGRAGPPATTTGRLMFANTTGAMCGPPVAAFVLLPAIGMERALFFTSLSYGLVGLLAISASWRAFSTRNKATLGMAAAVGVVMWSAFPFGLTERVYFPRAARLYTADGSTIVRTREGPSETIFLLQQTWLQQPVYHRLVTNGFTMTGTHLIGERYMRSFAYWPLLIGLTPRRVLVICYGLGVTVGAATNFDTVEAIDVVEISPDVITMSEHVYAPQHRPLADSRVRLHVEDGRQFLLASRERFDLITGEPPPPLTPGAVNIYSREYFQLIYDRLDEGGLATYWVPVARQGEYDVAPIIRAFCDVFRNCSLWNTALFDWMLVGSRGAVQRSTPETVSNHWQHPTLGPRLREIGFETPEQMAATFLGDADFLNGLTASVPPLTDNYPQGLLPRWSRGSSRHRGSMPEAISPEWFLGVIHTEGARARFAESPYVETLWPHALRSRSLPYFQYQGMINRIMLEGPNPVRDIDDLHRLLTSSSLRRLPLWMLGSNDILQRIAENGNDGTGTVEYQVALRALAIRNYIGAAANFAAAERRGLRSPHLRPLRAYALSMADRLDEAHALAPTAHPPNDIEQRFWQWMVATFKVVPKA